MGKPKTPKVAIICSVSVPWLAHCVDGIRRYATEQGGWYLFSSPSALVGTGESALSLNAMQKWKGDAAIAVSNNESELRMARDLPFPVVNLAGGKAQNYGIPRVMVDHFLAGRLAADHLLTRGLRHLCFFGWKDLWYSEQRGKGFAERAAESGVPCDVFLRGVGEESNQDWDQRISHAVKWLASLPRPSGVFAVHDYRAQLLLEACQEAALRIPEDIAVIGMDNDHTICEHSVPTLTSVSRNSERVGWEAAALLDRMMQGIPAPTDDTLLVPEGVVARQSTDMLYCGDPLVREALDFMRENLKGSFNIVAVADHVGVSKRTLETHFRENAEHSPHEYLTKLRVQRALTLMQTAHEGTIEEIARECGFGTRPIFYAAFRKFTGETPASFRRKLAGIDDPGDFARDRPSRTEAVRRRSKRP